MNKSISLVLIFFSVNVFCQSLMNETEFTNYFQQAASQSNKKIRIVVFDDLFLVSRFNGLSYVHKLDTYYSAYEKRSVNTNLLLRKFQVSLDSIYTPKNYRIDVSQVMPIIKSKKVISNFWGGDGNELVYDDLNEELAVVYAEDTGEESTDYRLFSLNELNRSDYHKDSLYSLSLKNFEKSLPDLSNFIWEGKNIRIYHGTRHGDNKYLASLILLPDFLNQEKLRIKQELIIAIPRIGELAVTGKKEKNGIKFMKKWAIDSYELGGRSVVSPNLFLWNGDKLIRYEM